MDHPCGSRVRVFEMAFASGGVGFAVTDAGAASAQGGDWETGPGLRWGPISRLDTDVRRSCLYSAFIRAIIFLFAALSFRLRRSLGFSKC